MADCLKCGKIAENGLLRCDECLSKNYESQYSEADIIKYDADMQGHLMTTQAYYGLFGRTNKTCVLVKLNKGPNRKERRHGK